MKALKVVEDFPIFTQLVQQKMRLQSHKVLAFLNLNFFFKIFLYNQGLSFISKNKFKLGVNKGQSYCI